MLSFSQNRSHSLEQSLKEGYSHNYEVLCNLSRRLPRIYHDGDQRFVTNELLK
ncbi:hypothetical protein JOC56_10170 [Staphylococcus aureus]|nr:hypothetical protein [Staphylococcus aureus]